MPMIDLFAPTSALDDAAAERLADELATILLRWEGAPDTEFFRGITWVYLHRTTPLVGGRPGGRPRFRVEVSVPQGALSQRRKAGLIREVHDAVLQAAGLADDPEGPMHVWTLIRDVPEGSWGAVGEPVQYAGLLEVSSAERATLDTAQDD